MYLTAGDCLLAKVELVYLYGLYFFSHQSCATGTLLLPKEIYPHKSDTKFSSTYSLTLTFFKRFLNRFLWKFEKKSKKVWQVRKSRYLCSPFRKER